MEICSNNKAKHRSQKLAFGIFRLLSLCIVLILFAILGFIIYKGSGAISWEFITSAPTDGMRGGGIWPAIVGTFYLMVGSALFAFPVGVMSGIYMNEYAPKGKLVRFIRVMTNNLSGIPSIVFGLFGMALFVNYMGFGDSILAGSLTLGLLCVPLVIRTTEEALKATGILDQCMALPYHLYVISTSGTDMEAQLPLAYGTALVLIVIILLVNLLANALRKYFEKRVKTN